ncbi:LOW QUALITY PROTEIN: upstream stimulatory factor 1 [Xenopus laevis]|uniref:Upstream stimulatory factor 1 n=5 Tax=Xenopus laevis TaxID=8355 RepID=A0A8J1LM62_XENLA|nr:LOW QUALITY PROTEIN: upstream stimulatory factor 1 [Xenopus laevis]
MKGQQKVSDNEEGNVRVQEGAVATGEDPTSVAIASIQSAATFSDPNVKYVFRTENGGTQVGLSYLLQVAEGQQDGQDKRAPRAISASRPTQHAAKAVIQGITSDDTGETEGSGPEISLHLLFPPQTDSSTSTVVTTHTTDTLIGQGRSTGTLAFFFSLIGQFYVMMSPQDVLQAGSQRSIAPRTHPYSPKSDGPQTTRDDKRRAQHNEVERRRRDKINNWIVQLSKIIPDCSMESTKSGQSKGGILSKACDYIQELRQSNLRLSEELQTLDQLHMDNDVLRQQVEDLKNKNLILRSQLRHHGAEIIPKTD